MSDEEDTPGEDASHDVQDRMARRLRTDQDEEKPVPSDTDSPSDAKQEVRETDQTDADSMTDQSEMSAKNKQRAKSAWSTENIRNAWTGVTVYLPDHLRNQFNDEYRRVDYELGGKLPSGNQLQKDRHYKPLIIALGIERLSRMERNELNEYIEQMTEHELPKTE